MPHRDETLLEAITWIAQRLLSDNDLDCAIQASLACLGRAVNASRAHLLQCHRDEGGNTLSELTHEWVASGITPQMDNPNLHPFDWKATGLEEWLRQLNAGGFVQMCTAGLLADQRPHFQAQDTQSMLLVSVRVEGECWGVLGFDECACPREWTGGEISALKTAANILGGSLKRQRMEADLVRFNERFRLAEQAGGIGVWDWDIGSNRIVWSETLEAMFGYGPGEFDGTLETFLEHVHPDDQDALDRGIEAAISDQGRFLYVHRILTLAGDVRWMRAQGRAIPDQAGNPVRMLGVAWDITSMRETQIALQHSEQRFRGLVEATSDWIWEVDRQVRYTYASPKVKELLGYEPEEVLGRTPFDLMTPQEAERVEGMFSSIAASRQPFTRLENINLHRNGQEVIMETSGVPIFDSNGEFTGYRGIDRDVTARVNTERELRTAETVFRQFADNIDEVFWIRDVDQNRMIYVNPAYEVIWGDSLGNIYDDPKRFIDLIHPEDRDRVVTAMQTHLREGGFDEEYRIVRSDGDVRWIHARSFTIRDESGAAHRITGIAEDITERKLREAKRLESEKQQRETLVREVHHRIKNNLQGIVGLLRRRMSTEPVLVELLGTVVSQIQSIAVVHGLQSTGRQAAVDFRELVSAIVGAVQDTYGVRLRLDLEERASCQLPPEDAVPVALIVNELLVNAVKHGDPGEDIRVTSASRPAHLSLRVENALPAGGGFSLQWDQGGGLGTGLELIRALVPPDRARLDLRHCDGRVRAVLELTLS